MFLFGLKMLWEAWHMKPEETDEVRKEVEDELQRRGSIASGLEMAERGNSANEERNQQTEVSSTDAEANDRPAESETLTGRAKKVTIQENSLFGKKCYKIFKVFVNCFTMTFLAEWGDRSQLATIVLASINDVGGVCVGGVLGHALCTGLAVIAGALVAKKISVRAVTFIGALVFIMFAIVSLFFDPESEEMIKIDV